MSEYDVEAHISTSLNRKVYVFEIVDWGVTVTIACDLRIHGSDEESQEQQSEAVYELLGYLPDMMSRAIEAEITSNLIDEIELHLKDASQE